MLLTEYGVYRLLFHVGTPLRHAVGTDLCVCECVSTPDIIIHYRCVLERLTRITNSEKAEFQLEALLISFGVVVKLIGVVGVAGVVGQYWW